MAWIESHQELVRHPKTHKLARMLGVPIPMAIGYLHLFWWWALDFASNGSLERYDADDIAAAAMWEGNAADFLNAMCAAGFIDKKEDGQLAIHDWWEYAGRLIQKRRADAERKRASRQRPADIQGTSNGHPTDGDSCPSDGAGNRTIPKPNCSKIDSTSTVGNTDKDTLAKETATGLADTGQQEQAWGNSFSPQQGAVVRDHTTRWRKPGEIPSEEAFRALSAKEQLNLLVKEHRRRFPAQYKQYGVGATTKTREVFGESIAGGMDPWQIFVQIAFWDEEMDGRDPPPWRIIQPLQKLEPGPDRITEQYMRYMMDKQAATQGVQVVGLSGAT